MHQSAGIRRVRDRPVQHTAVVPHEEIAELPFVPVADLAPCRMGGQLFDQRATLGLRDTGDMVHGHPEDERLASRAMAPDQRMLTPAPATRTLAASFRCVPARLLLRGGIRV